MHDNIRKIAWLEVMTGAMPYMAVFIPFLQQEGLLLRDVFLLQGIFALAIVLLEVPTGYVSDHWGRKQTLVAASCMQFIGMIFYGLGHSFFAFLLGELMLAIGLSLASGTKEAFVYECLAAENKEKTYRSVWGHLTFLHRGSEAITAIAGAALAVLSLRATFWVALIPYGIGIIIAVLLTEPPRTREQKMHAYRRLQTGIHTVRSKPAVRTITLLYTLMAGTCLALVWFMQPYQTHIGLPLQWFGVTFAVFGLLGAVASKYTHTIEKYVDDRMLLVLLVVVLLAMSIAMYWSVALWGLLFFGAVKIVWGVLDPLTSDMINQRIASDMRATILSLRSFGFRLLFGVCAPVIGYMADLLPLTHAIAITGITGCVGAAIVLMANKRHWNELPS